MMNGSAMPGLIGNISTVPSMIGNVTLSGGFGIGSPTKRIIEDAVFANDSLISNNWSALTLGCLTWKPPNHTLFQVANAVLFLGLMSPNFKQGVLFLHTAFVLSFLLLSVWAWIVLCAPDFFSWNFAFMIINVVQTLMILYNIKPIAFEENIERLYQTVFQPINVSRRLFKKLIDKNFCLESTLYEGDAYAMQGITKTDRLGLLVSGTMKVYSHRNILHLIQEMEFIDSPEFESSVTGDEKFQVSVYAASTCHYIYWPRHSLEYLLTKEPFLATILNTIMGRDITNKLYALNSRVKDTNTERSKDKDIPLTADPCGRSGDLRRTLAELSARGNLSARSRARGDQNDPSLVEEQEESEGPYSATEEEVDLLSPESKMIYDNHLARSNSSLHSDQGIQFTVREQSRIHFNIPAK